MLSGDVRYRLATRAENSHIKEIGSHGRGVADREIRRAPASTQEHPMRRYFFHVYDGYSSPDLDGTELPDIYTAQAQAIRTSGEILRDMGAMFWNGTEWKLEVA